MKVSAIRERYNNPKWYNAKKDRWHQFTDTKVHREVIRALSFLQEDQTGIIINVGAGEYDYGLNKFVVINLDISDRLISRLPNAVISNAEALPIKDNCIKSAICVGSVINYCDAASVISEFNRVVSPGGSLIIDFESSYSAEYLTRSVFRQSAAVAETFYASRPEAVWVYSFSYIRNLLKAANFTIIEHVPVHIVSPWALLLLRNANLAAATAPLDPWVENVSFLSRWASNHFLVCLKEI